MHHHHPLKASIVLMAAGLFLMAGCHTPQHSNVLVFGTNTKFAIDISYDPKTQEPNLTVGYKRQEGVWMPLLANTGEDGLEPGPIKINNKAGETVGNISTDGLLYQGKDNANYDAYSVLASFGAKWGAKGSATNGSEASGGLAQYFATGLAARKLAEKGGAELVSVQPAGRALAKEKVKREFDDAQTEGAKLTTKVNKEIDGIKDADKFKKAVSAAKLAGLIDDKNETSLTKAADEKLESGKDEFKTYMIAFSPEDVKKLKAFDAKLQGIIK